MGDTHPEMAHKGRGTIPHEGTRHSKGAFIEPNQQNAMRNVERPEDLHWK
jgi:hypothetical protein